MTTSELIATLREIEASHKFEVPEDQDYILEETHELVTRAVNLASEVLVNPNGQRDYYNEVKLSEEGFHVVPLEKDRFGWLVGGIITLKGIVAYD